ncbi:hypothetical protein D9756_002152 [Leucocoprinus leucothites]|uniref:NAD(P)-binding protein n=1 Tax=Leucocoprinus leucothites TaxID=201217 RepID=A0A8H5GC72_9AGAR|nr:hypothetical protein D9756_002152 [Leucoagaricus leucothites]
MSFFINLLRRKISEDDLVDLHGKVAIITGGNSGIGFTTIQFLARKGARVYMACRREEAYKEASKRLEEAGLGDGSVHWLHLDLSDPRLASKAAKEFLQKEDRLDILINNAARGSQGTFSKTKDGIQEAMVTNYLSHFVLAETLLPLMIQTSKQEGSDVRILEVTSTAHSGVSPASFKGKENWNVDYGTGIFAGLKFYALSKLANVIHMKHLQERLDAQNADIICIAVDPGAIATENVARWIDSMSYFPALITWILVSLVFVSPREGAMNSAYAAASPEVKARGDAFKGAHLTPVGRITTPSRYAQDDRLAKELYETSMEIVEELNLL